MKQILLRMRIGARLALAFAFLLTLTIAVGGYGVATIAGLADRLKQTSTQELAKVELTGRLRSNANVVARASRDLLLLESAGAIRKQRELVQKSLEQSEQDFASLQSIAAGAPESGLVQEVGAVRAQFTTAIGKYLSTLDQGSPDDARQVLLVDLRPVLNKYEEGLNGLSSRISETTHASAEDGEAQAQSSTHWMIGLSVLAVLVSSVVGLSIVRSIREPVRSAAQLAEAIANGNLSSRVAPEGRDEMAELLASMRSMQEKLSEVLRDVGTSSRQIAASSQEIAHGNQDLSSRTERSASNLQSTAADMEHISRTISGSTASTSEAARVAARTREIAQEGGTAVQDLVQTMEQIAGSSRKIQDIIGLIDGIAFQTNILALNAAVEAARAGEQGRGFAVVAGEVRALASRAADAAREIRLLIDASGRDIGKGTQIASGTGQRIQRVIEEVTALGALIQSVAAGAEEQSSGVSAVNGRMSELEQSTQQNAALVEELAATTEALNNSAARLLAGIEFFRIQAAAHPDGARPVLA